MIYSEVNLAMRAQYRTVVFNIQQIETQNSKLHLPKNHNNTIKTENALKTINRSIHTQGRKKGVVIL